MPLQATDSREPEGWDGPSESDWAGLHGRVGTLEASVRMVASGHAQLVEQMAEITVSQHRSGTRLDKLSTDLADNTAMSRAILQDIKDVHDVVVTAKTGGRLAKWAAPTLVAAAASIAVIKGWVHDLAGWLGR